MSHTSEERDNLSTPLCGAKKRSGGICRAFAGQGTPHKGIGRCKYHGGNTPSGRKHATDLEIRQKAVKLGTPIDKITPTAALMGILRATAGEVEWLRSEIIALEDLGTPEAAVLLRRYDENRDRLTRISESAIRSGAREEEVRVEENKAVLMISMVKQAAEVAGLSKLQVKAIGAALGKVVEEQAEALGREPNPDDIARADSQLEKLRAEIEEADEKRIQKAASQRPPEDFLTMPDEWVPAEDTA